MRTLRRLADTTFDVVVVGAGIYGAIAACDAARRGLSAALIDRGDFGSGTSANSLKTVHGGLRSLQALNLTQMRRFIRERRALARAVPHLLRVLPCVVPTYDAVPRSRAALGVALTISDAVASDRNDGVGEPRLQLPASRLLSREDCLAASPAIDPAGVTGGALWHDYQMRSADRIVLAFVRGAVTAGATVANYVDAERILLRNGVVEGLAARDTLTGDRFDLRARVVLNAAGPWAGDLLRRAVGDGRPVSVPTLSRAMNLVVRPFLQAHACGGRAAGRFLFAVPWGDVSIVGTSHDPHADGPDLAVRRSHVDGLFADACTAFPGANLSMSDVRLVHRGLLPAVAAGSPVRLLKESHVVSAAAAGAGGLVSIFSVRYTTARETAETAVDAVFRHLGSPVAPPCTTDRTPADGGDASDIAQLERDVAATLPGPTASHAARLVAAYGTRARALAPLLASPSLARTLSAESAITGAEIAYAARAEAALHLDDALMRRTAAGAAGHPGAAAIAAAAEVMGSELGWTESRRETERARVDALFALPT